MSQKNTKPKKTNLLMYQYIIKRPIIYLIFSAQAALIKSSKDFCLEGKEVCNANLQLLALTLSFIMLFWNNISLWHVINA